MRRCVIAHAEAVRDIPGFRSRAAMVTLTYRPGALWDRKQVSRYVTTVRNWLSRRGHRLRYQWVIETTRAGVPHYHVLFWLPHGIKLPKPDESGMWPHGCTRIEWATRAVGYLVKYATKGHSHDSKPLPFGSRLFGCGGDPTARYQAHRMSLPLWLHRAATPGEWLRRIPGGYLEAGTGAVHRSPYELTWGRDATGLVTLTVAIRGAAVPAAAPPVFQPTA